ncbi:MAG: hypothetical protein AAGI08_09895 [Bacteroidota bacterium]
MLFTLLATLLTFTPVSADDLELRPYTDRHISIQVPADWNVHREGNDTNHLYITGPRPERPLIFVLKVPSSTRWLDPPALAKLLTGTKRGQFSPATVASNKRSAEFTTADGSYKAFALLARETRQRYALLTLIAAPAGMFDQINAPGLLATVAYSAVPGNLNNVSYLHHATGRSVAVGTNFTDASGQVEQTDFYTSSVRRGGKIDGKPLTKRALQGRWIAYEGMGSMNRRDVGRTNTQGMRLVYHFKANGTYTLDYSAQVSTGTFRSATEVDERGRYSVSGGMLTLKPSGYDGWIRVASKQEAVRSRTVPARTYDAVLTPDGPVIAGECAPFQVDAICGRKAARRTLTFSLVEKQR